MTAARAEARSGSDAPAPRSEDRAVGGRLPALLERVARLGAAAARFDPIGRRFIEGLLERAASLPDGAKALVLRRAEGRLDAFEAAFRGARASAVDGLAALRAAGAEPDSALREALAGGDFEAVERGVRRRLEAVARAKRPPRVTWAARLRGREAPSQPPPESGEAPLPAQDTSRSAAEAAGDPGPEATSPLEAGDIDPARSLASFRDSAEHARAALAVARATDNLPEEAGPYNTQLLAARVLHALAELSPEYLRTFVAAIDDLAALDAITAVPPEAKRRRAKPGNGSRPAPRARSRAKAATAPRTPKAKKPPRPS